MQRALRVCGGFRPGALLCTPKNRTIDKMTRNPLRGLAAAALAVGAAVLAVPAFPATLYVATPLGTLGGSFSTANAINNSGQVTGYAAIANGDPHAFFYSAGKMVDLGTFGGETSYGIAINASGVVTGAADTSDGVQRAFVYIGGVVMNLGALLGEGASAGTGINDSGQVVGTYGAGTGGFIYAAGVVRDLGVVADGVGIQPSGINASGQVAGTVYFPSNIVNANAYLYSTSQSTNLGTIGAGWTMPSGLNDSGQVTGIGATGGPTTHTFLYSGSMHDLGTIGAFPDLLYSAGLGINNAGQVVGYSELLQYSDAVAFLYTDGVMYDLNTLVYSGLGTATLTEAIAINDRGQIVANSCPYSIFGESCTAFRLDPIPPPTVAAVEYYYGAWNYYFETSFPDEIAALDGGAFGGVWKRTGQTFNVWPQPNVNSSPTCRFFSTDFAPKSSHVYTPFASECASLKVSPDWRYEGIAFHIQLASTDGLCTDGTIPLYRLYNNGMGGAPNHRYTTSMAILDEMIASGWIFEGNGNTTAFACVPL